MSDEIDELLASRDQDWGNPVLTWARVAQVWSGILDHEVTPHQAVLCMAGFKLVRAELSPDNPDSYDDAKAYVRISERIIGVREQDVCTCEERGIGLPRHDADCPVHGVAASNARQSEFYASHDRTIPAGPDDKPIPYHPGPLFEDSSKEYRP